MLELLRHMKIILLLSSISILLITGCSKEKRERIDDSNSNESEQSITADKITDEELHLFPSLFIEKLSSYRTYKSVTSGETKAVVLGITIPQSIEATAIQSDYSYLINESHSSMVNTTLIAYFHENMAVYKDNQSDYKTASLNEYLSIYGIYPFEYSIEGYSVSHGVTVTRLESETNYKFRLAFDKELTTNNVKIQMKKIGGLDDYPSFKEDTVMDITVQNDFTPISLTLTSHYSAKKIIESDCRQNYTVTYSDYNQEIEIPNLDNVKHYFEEN